MENQFSPVATSTTIQFIPSGPIDTATRNIIRSHVTFDARRKQRQQRLITLQAKPSKPKSVFFEENLCKCLAVGFTTNDLSHAPSVHSRSVLQRQLVADSYKVCLKCRGVQFTALSQHGKLKAARTHPTIIALLQTGFDPMNSMPEVPNLSPGGLRAVNDIKAFGKRELHLRSTLFWSNIHFRMCNFCWSINANEMLSVVTFLTPGLLKTILFPAAIQIPSLLMSFLYSSCWNLVALRDYKDPDLEKVGLILKREAIRQINIRITDPKLAFTSGTVSAIGWLSAGVMVWSSKT